MMSAEERVRILSEAKPNSWLAFASDESKVVGRGNTYMEAVEDAERHGEFDPIMVRIPESWEPRVFNHCVTCSPTNRECDNEGKNPHQF